MVVPSILSASLPGTRRLMAQHGSALVCEGYRNNSLTRTCRQTVELIVAEQSSELPARPSTASVSARPHRERSEVPLRTSDLEHDLRTRIKRVGGRWLPDLKIKSKRRRYVISMRLRERIVRLRDSTSSYAELDATRESSSDGRYRPLADGRRILIVVIAVRQSGRSRLSN